MLVNFFGANWCANLEHRRHLRCFLQLLTPEHNLGAKQRHLSVGCDFWSCHISPRALQQSPP